MHVSGKQVTVGACEANGERQVEPGIPNSNRLKVSVLPFVEHHSLSSRAVSRKGVWACEANGERSRRERKI